MQYVSRCNRLRSSVLSQHDRPFFLCAHTHAERDEPQAGTTHQCKINLYSHDGTVQVLLATAKHEQ